jgi:hypothetical protein
MVEGLETLEQEQNVLAKIACVPGKMACIAAWMKQFFAVVLLEADEKAKIWTTSEKVIKFSVGQKFSDAFKPEQSDDAKFVNVGFCMTTEPLLSSIRKHTPQAH